jgi:succinoglycan biosynthesis protein ExoA
MASNPIRILHLIASNFVGGPEKQILHHALDLQNSDFEVWVGSFRDRPEKAAILQQAEESGLRTYESLSSGRFDPRAVLALASFLKRQKIQLLCTHGFKANTVGALAKSVAGVPQIAFCRGWTAETMRVRAYEALERRFLALADRIICVSEAQAEYFATKHLLQPRISVVHNAMLDSIDTGAEFDREAAKTQLGFSPTTLLIGAVGRLSVEKGQRYLVEAASSLVREFKDLKIVLLGEGRERESLESQVKRLGLENVVVLPGFHKNVARWMQAFDVLANCSLTEGIPNAILEALAVGTPVVATAAGGVPELIKDRETGLLVAAGSSEALAGGLAEVLRDSSLASKLGQAGREWVRTRFSASVQRDSLLEAYREVLGLSGASPGVPNASATSDLPEIPSSSSRRPTSSKPKEMKPLPFISVVIPVRNEEAHLSAVLESLLGQDYPRDRYEILVADGDSTDGTSRVVEKIASVSATRVRLLSNPLRWSSAGRNVGVRHSSGELVVFVDGHCHIPSRTLLRDAAATFERTGADCLCRPQPLNMEGNNFFQDAVAHARATALGHGRDSTIYDTEFEGLVNPCSAGAMYRRTVFERVGYYDESFDAAEDVEFNYRVFKSGLVSYISPRLEIRYQPRASLGALWRQMVRYGRGRFRLIQKHHDAFSISQLVPAVFLLWLVVGVIASLVSRPLSLVFGVPLAIYVAVVLYFSLGMGRRHGVAYLLVGPLIYPAIHLGLGAGFLAEALQISRNKNRSETKVSSTTSEKSPTLEPPS